MIQVSQKFLDNLNIYDGIIYRSNSYKELISVDFEMFCILFNLKDKNVMISDLLGIKDWLIVRQIFKKKEIQSIIDLYYNKYNNLKAFY